MKKISQKTVFFGSGPVAAKSLELLMSKFEVEAVITKPSTVKQMAPIAKGVCIHSVNTRADLDDLISAQQFEAEFGILIDFGIIVSKMVIDSFKKGVVNSHFSLLPEWRGADPITFSLLSGQEKTGVSLMLLDEGMDTGKVLVQKSLTISSDDTGATLTDKLIVLSDQLLKENLEKYIAGTLKPRSQPHPDRATYSRKLTKEDGVLDFNKPAEELECEIRAFLEWPKSRTEIAGKDVVILKAHSTPGIDSEQKPGDITVVKESGLIAIATTNGSLWIEELKPAGKKAMPTKAFLAGYGNKL